MVKRERTKKVERKPSKKKQKQIDRRKRYDDMMKNVHEEIKDLKKDKQLSGRIRYCESSGTRKVPCCQYRTEDGTLCSRAAMLEGKTYIPKFDCCYLCWQHASLLGLYGLLSFAKFAQDQQLSYGEFYAVYPEEFLKLPEQGKQSVAYVKDVIKKLSKQFEKKSIK